MSTRVQRPLILFLLLSALPLGCAPRNTQWDEAQKKKGPAVSKEAVEGSVFNKFFPKGEGDDEVVYTQEKTGEAEARLKRKGTAIATLAVFDTVSNPGAADKYRDATEVLQGYPLLHVGKHTTEVLVADRFQVVVRSTPDSGMGKDDRKEWLKKFDLKSISNLR
jgi:hypothetical protein